MRDLAGYVRQRLAGGLGLEPATPSHPDLHGSLTAFRLPAKIDPAALRRHLWERHRIEAPVIERPEGLPVRFTTPPHEKIHPADCLIRVSTHFYNTREEIDRLALALDEFLPQRGR